jgi:CheY-like chemotaxis protein
VRALVIDDSRAIRLILGQILRALLKFEIIEAGHGLEALERLKILIKIEQKSFVPA